MLETLEAIVIGTLGDENGNREQREPKRCQIVEEAEC